MKILYFVEACYYAFDREHEALIPITRTWEFETEQEALSFVASERVNDPFRSYRMWASTCRDFGFGVVFVPAPALENALRAAVRVAIAEGN